MAINLLNLQPNKVSRDLSGYITYIYGAAKVGKTTFATRAPGALLLAFERGYSALPGVVAQDITSWSEMKQVVRELKKEEVKKVYKVLVVDTIDIASDLCQKYLCNQLGIDNIGDGGWAVNGWSKYKKEFEETFRTLAMLGYAIFFISHGKEKTIKPQFGEEYQQICPSLQSSAEAIIENMSDIIGYAQTYTKDGVTKRVLTLRTNDNSIVCGSRFKLMAPEIEFTYEALTKALNDAIDAEAEENNNKYVTTERIKAIGAKAYDYDKLMSDIKTNISDLMSKDQNNNIKITSIVDKYLGKGKKVSEATPTQCEQLELILIDLQELNSQG